MRQSLGLPKAILVNPKLHGRAPTGENQIEPQNYGPARRDLPDARGTAEKKLAGFGRQE